MALKLRHILTLFKLRIGIAMVMTALAGLAVTPGDSPGLAQTLLLAIAVLISAGAAGGLNHYFDVDLDVHMERTNNRPFVTGALTHSRWWLLFLGVMLAVPVMLVAVSINVTTALYVFLGAFFYGVVYTVWLKRRTWMNIVIGGLAGSFAVLAGTSTVNAELTPLSVSFALVLFLWTPSHFWSLAIRLKDQYAAAGVPMLPVVAGESKAAKAILFNTVLLVAASILPFFFGMGWLYLSGALLGGGYFLYRSLILVKEPTTPMAMINFRASLIQLVLLLLAATLDSQFMV